MAKLITRQGSAEFLSNSAPADTPSSGGLQQSLAHVRQHFTEIDDETRTHGAIDDAMVIRQRQRHDQARRELLAIPDGLDG